MERFLWCCFKRVLMFRDRIPKLHIALVPFRVVGLYFDVNIA